MKKLYTLSLIVLSSAASMFAQTTILNGDFELWENTGSATEEPLYFNSNRTGTDWAPSGPQTCYRDNSTFHSGSYSCRTETKTFVFAVVNGSVTTGIVNAPTTTKTDGYIGTMKNTDVSDIRRMAFVGRPDSLIGWYKYTKGGTGEKAKIVAHLHKGHYYDPDAGTSYHPDSSANRIATALFNSPSANVSAWTRFSVPFVYVDGRTPEYIMVNATPSDDQNTSVSGSKLWIDDVSVVYNATGVNTIANIKQGAKAYCYDKVLNIDFMVYNESSVNVSVYDVTGKVVASQKFVTNKEAEINLANLNAGMYFYQIAGADFQKSGKFFIK